MRTLFHSKIPLAIFGAAILIAATEQAAKADVHQLIDDLARDGVAVMLISSDLPEVLAMSDRIVVMREGRVRAVFGHDEADPERVMAAAVAA